MSRWDNIGLFWQDLPTKGAKGKRQRMMPPIPDTGWVPPRDYPNLAAARALSVDLECKDPELQKHGPGWARNKGHICGFSVCVPEGDAWYFPIRHEVEPEWNLPPEHALFWLKDTLERNPNVPIVGANLIYDYGWLKHEGINPVGDLIDIQFAEALLDPSAEVSLEAMSWKYLGIGKVTEVVKKWIMEFYAPPEKYWRRDLYRAPPRLVGPYGEGDAVNPMRIAPLLFKKLEEEGLVDLFNMECYLIRLIVDMRFAGVSVDVPKAEQLHDDLKKLIKIEQAKLKSIAGFDVNVNASASLAKAFNKFELKYPMTAPTKKKPKGQPSFKGDFLKKVDHPVAQTANTIKLLKKLNGTFVKGYILDGHVAGKLFCSFHPLKGESGGTGVGRYASSNPNLQNIPVRSTTCVHGNEAKTCPQGPCLGLGKYIRTLFIPDAGHKQWRKYDYSQIQYRFLVNYAVGPGADEARQKYIDNPDTDYHDMVLHMVQDFTGREWDRRPVKNLNFGLSFGMGDKKAGESTGLKGKELEAFLEAYHKAAPFGKATMKHLMEFAEHHGYIRTVLNRKARFDLWEPAEWGTNKPPLPYELAIRQYGRVRRAKLHKSLAFLLQGCEGDMMKAAMARAYKEGLFDYIGVPRLLVHDEFDFSDPGGKDEAFEYFRHILENVIPLRIPIRSDCEVGKDWGSVKDLKSNAVSFPRPEWIRNLKWAA